MKLQDPEGQAIFCPICIPTVPYTQDLLYIGLHFSRFLVLVGGPTKVQSFEIRVLLTGTSLVSKMFQDLL